MFYPNFVYTSLIFYGVHVGHSFDNTVLYSAWLVWAFRQGIALINLFKFVIAFRASSLLIANLIQTHFPIWFINLDISMEKFVGYAAISAGEYFTGSFWCRGLISNFSVVVRSFRKSANYPYFMRSRYQEFMSKTLSRSLLGRTTWPRMTFISSVFNSYFPARESLNAEIPTIGVVDTNTLTQSAAPPMPGNDDSSHAIIYYNTMVASFILKRKFTSVSRWYEAIKRSERFQTFQSWVSAHIKRSDLDVYSAMTNYTYNSAHLFSNSLFLYRSLNALKKTNWLPLFTGVSAKNRFNVKHFPKTWATYFRAHKDQFYASSVFQSFQLYSFIKTRYYLHHMSTPHFMRHRFFKQVYERLIYRNRYRWYKRRVSARGYTAYYHRMFVYLLYKTYLKLNPRYPSLGKSVRYGKLLRKRGKRLRLPRKLYLSLKPIRIRRRLSVFNFKNPLLLNKYTPRTFLLATIWSHIYKLWSSVFFTNESLFHYSQNWSITPHRHNNVYKGPQ